MNCKPGDLAVIVRSYAGNLGRIVTVLRLATAADYRRFNVSPDDGPAWLVDQKIRINSPSGRQGAVPLALDERLRPIRDNDAADETLTWAGLPATTEESSAVGA